MTVLAALLLAGLERVPATRFRPAPLLRPHVATDLCYLLTGFGAGGAIAAAYVRAASAWVAARTGIGPLVWPLVPFWVRVAVGLVAIDLGNYAVHWALHRSDVLWEFHKAHHSSHHLTGSRLSDLT